MSTNTFFFWLVLAACVTGVVSGRLELWTLALPCAMLVMLFIVTPLRILSGFLFRRAGGARFLSRPSPAPSS